MVHQYQSVLQRLKSSRLKMYLIYGIMISLLAVVCSLIVFWYFSQQQGRAQKMYAESAEQYQRGLAGVEGAWQDLEFISQLGYDNYSSSVFGPYFLGLKGEGQLQQNQQNEALDSFAKLMDQLPSESPLFFLYATKHALIKLDSNKESIRKAGVLELADLAYNASNLYQDEARYYLGVYQLTSGDKQAAKNTFLSLVEEYGIYESEQASPWAALAETKLIGL